MQAFPRRRVVFYIQVLTAFSGVLIWSGAGSRATVTDTRPDTLSNPEIATPEPVKTNPFTGSASYAYRFDVPPGTGGLTPELVLTYSTMTKNTE